MLKSVKPLKKWISFIYPMRFILSYFIITESRTIVHNYSWNSCFVEIILMSYMVSFPLLVDNHTTEPISSGISCTASGLRTRTQSQSQAPKHLYSCECVDQFPFSSIVDSYCFLGNEYVHRNAKAYHRWKYDMLILPGCVPPRTVPEIILSEAYCQVNRGINAVQYSNLIPYLSFFSFGFSPAFFCLFFRGGYNSIKYYKPWNSILSKIQRINIRTKRLLMRFWWCRWRSSRKVSRSRNDRSRQRILSRLYCTHRLTNRDYFRQKNSAQ